MLIHLPIVVLAALHPLAVADTAPKFDIARECRYEGGPPEAQQRCAADEAEAYSQLQKESNLARAPESNVTAKPLRTPPQATSNC